MAALAPRGVIPILVCTEPFEQLARVNAAGHGLADLHLIVIPHPLGTRPLDEVSELGRSLAPRVLEILRSGGAGADASG
jgi:hypothetical protein